MSEKIKVIIVEDHLVTLEGLTGGLSRYPDIVVSGTATNMQDGLRCIESSPDITLLDLHLPDSEGPRSLINAFHKTNGPRTIVFSGEKRTPLVQMALQQGVSAYLLKSEAISKVAETIRRVHAGEQPIISDELSGANVKLTAAEQHLVRMLARGMKYQDIAEARVTAPATVRKQVEVLLLKLNLASREELIVWAAQNGYAELGLEQ